MRIVIDTNIWISGLLWRGLAWQLLRLAEQGPVKLCMAPAMLDELSYVLTYQKLQARLSKSEDLDSRINYNITCCLLTSYFRSTHYVERPHCGKTAPLS